MSKNKSKIMSVLLIFVTIFLIGAIFYISTLLSSSGDQQTSVVAPRKTRAANVTYSKLIALNQVTPELSSSPTLTPAVEALTQALTSSPSPSPTETVLAYVGSTGTASSTLTPTKVKNLPDAGFVYNGLIIFAASMVLVFFSFLF